MRRTWVLCVTVMVVCLSGRAAEEVAKPITKLYGDNSELLSNLQSDDLAVADRAEAELARHLESLADGLLKIVAAQGKINEAQLFRRTPRDRAMAVLGEDRSKRIIRPLLMNVCYFNHGTRADASLTAGYPCATMLCGLGPTAAYEIVKYLELPPAGADLSDEAVDLFARVFVTVYSNNGGIEEAQAMLTRARRRAKNTEHIDRLQKAIREFGEKKSPPPPSPNAP